MKNKTWDVLTYNRETKGPVNGDGEKTKGKDQGLELLLKTRWE
jgi:hypothetical protein